MNAERLEFQLMSCRRLPPSNSSTLRAPSYAIQVRASSRASFNLLLSRLLLILDSISKVIGLLHCDGTGSTNFKYRIWVFSTLLSSSSNQATRLIWHCTFIARTIESNDFALPLFCFTCRNRKSNSVSSIIGNGIFPGLTWLA